MVTGASIPCAWKIAARLPLAAQAADRPELPPPTRAAMQMALIGIALVGLLLVVIVLLGGHWVRRQGGRRRWPAAPPDRAPIRPAHRKPETSDHDESP